jgi:hypothetical protein
MKKLFAEVQEACESGPEMGWKETGVVRNVRICKRDIEGSSVVMVRGTGRIERHPMCIFEMLDDLSIKTQWNHDFVSMEVKYELDQTCRVRCGSGKSC